MEEKKKMGRPTTNPKIKEAKLRMTQEEFERLEFCCKKTKKTKTEIINMGIDRIYQELL